MLQLLVYMSPSRLPDENVFEIIDPVDLKRNVGPLFNKCGIASSIFSWSATFGSSM
jgi:hypothetical protein